MGYISHIIIYFMNYLKSLVITYNYLSYFKGKTLNVFSESIMSFFFLNNIEYFFHYI